jgi:hypothetical protein
MSRSGSGKPDTDLEGVELLFYKSLDDKVVFKVSCTLKSFFEEKSTTASVAALTLATLADFFCRSPSDKL